jgi:hypothetical protein
MIKSIQFSENIDEFVPKNNASHRIFCLDCSGSMSGSMSDMRKQMKNKLPALIRDTDFVSIIWFSGSGQYGTIFEHVSIQDLNDLQKVHSAIDRYLHSMGSTGFVEPIRKAKELAEQYSEQPQVFFLSDGGENCWPLDETRKAFADMKGIPMVIVEYQYYCDRTFLQELAALSDAVSVFNEDFEMYDDTFSAYMQNCLSKMRTIDVDSQNDIVYFDNGTFVVKNGKNGHVSLPEHIPNVWEIKRDWNEENNEENNEEKEENNQNVYVAMLYALQTRCHLLMKKCLSLLGDVYLTKRYSVCFSKQDYSRMFETVKSCYLNPSEYAFIEGVDHTFSPADDSFNVIECLNMLENDKKSRFYPYHPSFAYERISKEVKDEMVRFAPNRDIGSSYSLVFNQSRANISLGCQVYGYNETTDEKGDVTIAPVSAYRNYTVLKDGIKHVNVLPMKISSETYEKLLAEKCVKDAKDVADEKDEKEEKYDKNKIYEIDLSNLPVVNRKFVSTPFTSTDFCEKHIQLHIAKGNVKYLKKMLEELEKEEKKEDEVKDEVKEENKYERKKFDPSAVRDFYSAPELNVKIAKCSTIPTINEKLLTKMNTTPTKLTLSEELLYKIHTLYKNVQENDRKEWLLERLSQEKVVVKALTMELEQSKMAILVGGCWFSGTSVDEKTFTISYNYAGVTHTFEVTVETNDVKIYMD